MGPERIAQLAAASERAALSEEGLNDFIAAGREQLAAGKSRAEVIAVMYLALLTETNTPVHVDELKRGLAIAAVRLAELPAPPEPPRCPYDFGHTSNWCGYDMCRES